MKNVLFDLYSAQSRSGQRSGGYEFVFSIFAKLSQYHNRDIVLSVFYDADIGLYDWIKQIIKVNNIIEYDVKDIHEIYDICENNNIDIFYSGMPYQYTFKFASDRVVKIGNFHGIREYELPDDEYMIKYVDYSSSRLKDILRELHRQWLFSPIIKQRRWCRQREIAFTE